MKGQILNILKTETEVFSGEMLSARLGISRVSVWKHIKKLQEVGYKIEATPKGYLFISAPDALYPWEFGDKKYKIHYFDEVDSTMDIARELARKQCPHFTVVIAGCQKKGRGRLKRSWLSSEDRWPSACSRYEAGRPSSMRRGSVGGGPRRWALPRRTRFAETACA